MSQPNVLLVDDRPENLVALQAVLAPLGCRLVTATSGAEALRALLDEEFAVILLDVQMPELDGFETAEYIKRRERTRTVPIIFVTAISKEEHHVFRGYESGAVDYVFKPYEPVVLRSKVAVFLDLWRQRQALERSEALASATFTHAPLGMARMDRDGHILAANPALASILAIDAGELVGRTLDELSHPEDRRADRRQRAALLAGEIERYDVERRLLGAEGTVPAGLSFAYAPAGLVGEPVLLVQVSDLRERKRAERARELLIREQAARLEAEAVSERLRAIQRVIDVALEPLDSDALLAELLVRIAEVLRVDNASVVLADEEEGGHVIVQAAGGLDGAVRRTPFHAQEHGPVARTLRDRAPVVVEDTSPDPVLADPMPGVAVASLLCVPLLAGGQALGVLVVGSVFPRAFSEGDVDLLQLAGDRAALAIQRARVYEREHRIASQLQRSLLPERLPAVPGLRLAARYLPGGAGTEVGGDWYDALALPGGRLCLVMGDVQGRGVPAAAMMGQLRSALRAYALEGASPAQVLERLNRFQLQLGEDRMATVLMLVLDPDAGTLTYANAGHPPPLLAGPAGVGFLDGGRGVPLGAADDPEYAEATAELELGSTIVLYTDGLIEHRGHSLQEGFDRLRAALDTDDVDPEALCEAILGGTLGGAAASDDVTFMVATAPALLGDRVTLSLPGRADGLASLRATMRRWLAEVEADLDEAHAITMATNEAVQNAIEHAHRRSPEPFVVELAREGDQVTVTIRDRGRWREEGGDDDRGRGLPLMRALMDAVDLAPAVGGTSVVLRRRLRAGAPVAAR